MVLPLNVRDIAQRQRHGIGDGVFHADPVQGGGKLTGVGGADKEQHDGDGGQVFQHQIEMIKQLLLCEHIVPAQTQQHMLRPVNAHAVLGREEKDQHIVQHHEYGGKAQHEGHIPDFDPGDAEKHDTDHRQHRQKAGVIGGHGGQAPQQQAHQLCGSGEPVYGRGAVDVVEDIGHLRHTSRS